MTEELTNHQPRPSESLTRNPGPSMTEAASTKPEFSGVLVIDKPAGITSHDVVARVPQDFAPAPGWHFGRSIPFATGVLPVSVGKATRSRSLFEVPQGLRGYDPFLDSPPTPTTRPENLHRKRFPWLWKHQSWKITFANSRGGRLQTPPPIPPSMWGGSALTNWRGEHKPVNLTPVEVEIYALELLSSRASRCISRWNVPAVLTSAPWPHDLGQKLGCGAHLVGLRRTAVAEFTLSRAVTLERLQEAAQEAAVDSCLFRLEALLPDCPELVVRGREETSVRHGHAFELCPGPSARAGERLRGTRPSSISSKSRLGTPPDRCSPARFRRHLPSQPGFWLNRVAISFVCHRHPGTALPTVARTYKTGPRYACGGHPLRVARPGADGRRTLLLPGQNPPGGKSCRSVRLARDNYGRAPGVPGPIPLAVEILTPGIDSVVLAIVAIVVM